MPRQQPKAFLISISISRKNYNENKSYWGREQTLNIKVHARQELARNNKRGSPLGHNKAQQSIVTLLTYLPCKVCTKQYLFPHLQPHHVACGILVPLPKQHPFKALFQISSITVHFFLTLCFIRHLLFTRLWARPQRNIMNNAQRNSCYLMIVNT